MTGVQVYFSKKQIEYLKVISSNFYESAIDFLGEEGAEKLSDKLRDAYFKAAQKD